jgi:DNA-binding transcriptional ArsR family regulator
MTYRIHFTTLDLARTRVTDAPGPLVELNLAIRILQNRTQPARLDAWRRRAWARLTDDTRLALALIPPFGYSPTFPRTLVDDEGSPQPIVSYPTGLEHPLRSLTAVAPESRQTSAVAALLGTTRSAVLTFIAEHPGCSTKELAALAGVAPASASEHATVLRGAGLISTVRYRNAALHSVTSLGLALLNAPPHNP